MSKEEKIQTLHPQGKNGVNISKKKYDLVKAFILKKIKQHQQISYSDLCDLAMEEVQPTFDGKIIWYVVSVKLDLEARDMIERVPKTSPHELRMKE